MSIVSQIAAIKGRLSWRSFVRLTESPEEVQQNLLRRMLEANQETAYGRHHRFSKIASIVDYRDAVPVGDYEVFRPWIDRIQQGERRVLTAEDPYMFTLTSGTAAKPKFIPVNPSARRSTRRLSSRWLYRCLVDHSKVLDHKALVVVSPAIEGYTPSGIPFGSASGYIYRHASWSIRHRYAVPYPVFAIKDFDTRYYTIMRFAIDQRVSLIATPNPGTILRLVTIADNQRDQLIRDIHDGTMSGDMDVTSDISRDLRSALKPNPNRAKELGQIVTETGSLTPQHYWPDLRLVGCWKGGSVGSTVDRLRPWFDSDTPFRDIGYLSSEAYMTLPIRDDGCEGILALDTNFYEFIPEAEIGSARARALTVEQLEEGESYYILISSANGLYRYDINDVVKVTGYFRKTPMVEFVRKGRDMVSLQGEKLHVGQLIKAVEAAQLSTGVKVEYFRAVGNIEASRYDLKLELAEYPVHDDLVVSLGQAIDQQLATLNIEYDQKRRSGRLHPPHVQVMAKGWSSKRLQNKLQRALRDIQFKDNLLGMPDEEDRPADVIKELALYALADNNIR